MSTSWTVCSTPDCNMNLPPGRKCPLCDEPGKLQKVAVVVDDYKLEPMEKALIKNSFLFESMPGPTNRFYTFFVWTINPKKLKKVVTKVNDKHKRI